MVKALARTENAGMAEFCRTSVSKPSRPARPLHTCYVESSPWSFPAQEASLSQSASADLPMLAVADQASRLLFEVIGRTPVPPSHTECGRDISGLQHKAIWFMAIIATRSLRACMAVMTVGYEDRQSATRA